MNRALLVGINNYQNLNCLEGCVNDIEDVAGFLQAACGFSPDEICILRDNEADALSMLEKLSGLVNGLSSGDRVLFYYSGHGVQMDNNGVVADAICPYDFHWAKPETAIRDEDFLALFANIPENVDFIWVSDSCHSGDLFREALPERRQLKSPVAPADIRNQLALLRQNGAERTTMKGVSETLNLAFIAACASNQVAEDGIFAGRSNGAMTFYLLRRLEGPGGLQQSLAMVVKLVHDDLDPWYPQDPSVAGDPELIARGFLTGCYIIETSLQS